MPVFWHLKAQGPFLYAKEIFVKCAVIILLGAALWRFNKFFSIFLIYSFVYSFWDLTDRNLWALQNLRDFFLFYLLVRISVRNEKIKSVLWLWLIALVAPIVMSWLQYFNIDFLPRTSHLFYSQAQYWKIGGFFGNTHILVSWVALCSPLVFLMPIYLSIPALSFLIVSLVRFKAIGGGLMTLIISTGFTLVLLRFKRIPVLPIILLVLITISLTAIFLGDQIAVRKEILLATWPKILEHPIIGHGLNSYSSLGITIRNTFEAQAHNEYLQAYTEFGLFSLIIVFFVFYYLRRFNSIIKNREGCIISGIFIAFLINAGYSFPFHLAHASIFFLTIVALFDNLIEAKQ